VTATEHYQQARARALEVRVKYGLTTPRVMVSDLKKIYRAEGIGRVDYWDRFKGTKLKGAYFNNPPGPTVVINKKIIKLIDPKVFTMGHELKHHLMDEVQGISLCSDDNEQSIIERAADVFAAELIYPVDMFFDHMAERTITKGKCTAEHIVRLKHETKTTLSHSGLAIRASRFGFALPGVLDDVNWHNLRDRLYPEYRAYRSYQRQRAYA
jgi:Zn-dependent peptidase ImmA (M78 family)